MSFLSLKSTDTHKIFIISNNPILFQLEGRFAIVTENSIDVLSVSQTNTIEMTFEHKSDENVLHKLSVVFIVKNEKAVSRQKKSDQFKCQLALIHTNRDQKMWMVRVYQVFIEHISLNIEH